MNYTSYLTDDYLFKIVNLINIKIGKYKIFKYGDDDNKYALVSVNRPENLKYQIDKHYNKQDHQILKDNLKEYHINLEKININLYSKEFDVEEMNKPIPDSKHHLICEINKEDFKVFFIEETLDEKIYKYPIYTNINSILLPNMNYPITNFKILNNNISIRSYVWSNDKIDRKDESKSNYINRRVIDILKTYFKYEDEKIICMYNNKKEIAKLTLITKDEIMTEDGNTKILQSLRLEIDNTLYFDFYINNPKIINYKKKNEYYFLTMYIYNDFMFNNLILGYEFINDEYYILKYEEKLILKNIDKEITKKFKNIEKTNIYTYLLSNNEKCGMTISIDEDYKITHKLVKLNNEFFKLNDDYKTPIDISLLKPVNEWNDNNNNYHEIDEFNEFDSVVEEFGYEDERKEFSEQCLHQ